MKIKNQKGFTITEVLVAAGMLGIVSLVAVQLTKDMAANKAISDVNNDINSFKQKTNGLFINPSDCNANFRGDAANGLSTPITGIFKCTGTHCSPNGSGTPGATPEIPVVTTSWDKNTTKLGGRLRLTALTQQITAVTSTSLVLSSARVTATVQGRISTATSNQAAKVKTKEEVIVFTVPVVVNGATNTVSGCPRSWNTTIIY